ncbi:hypothetical protein B0H34DRAFT_666642 [Crassisporium funariophilum]|nr:hypothetical protein B0H34DRAFT_666642 [Crassisporium funariophilum]
MTDIPPEIWLHIAKFIPDKTLGGMIGVNSVFFDVAMDIRYKEVVIETKRRKAAMTTLQRLRESMSARRVQRLSLRLTHYKDSKGGVPTADPRHTRYHTLQDTFQRVFRSSRKPVPHQQKPTMPSFADLINDLIAITPGFVNVHELFIDSWDLPPTYNLHPLFTSFWSSFGNNLRAVSLGCNLDGYRVLTNSQPTFSHLQDFRMEFINNLFHTDQEAEAAILVNDLAPFINGLSPHLESFRVWSWVALDLSAFFDRLSLFPALRCLNVRAPFNRGFTNASGLKGLICDNAATLQKVDLRLNPSGISLDPSAEEPLSQWLLECTSDPKFLSNLHALEIYPTILPGGMVSLLGCIHRNSQSLKELIVRDRYLQRDEVHLVLDAASLCKHMTYLRLNVWKLDVALMDYMGTKIPHIQRLWLSIAENGHNDPASSIDTFVQEMHTRSYTNWKLKDITIWQGGEEVDGDIMLALARSIPSVQSFYGNGHMDHLKNHPSQDILTFGYL